ncbi:MAG: RHS repeat protein [Phycisphaerae bacterium]|nr:RHS repeat protein [Phycisphaerae bacterium]
MTIVVGLAWMNGHQPVLDFASTGGIRTLSDAEMRQVVGGWLQPKARNPRGGCLECQECVASSGHEGPSVDVTTNEVYERLDALSVGSDEAGLSLELVYSSTLADGTNTVVDTTMGAGWTHSYNDTLLDRGADMLWMRGDGGIVKFTGGRGGVYTASTGDFFTFSQTSPTTGEVVWPDGTLYQFQQRSVPWEPSGIPYLLDAIIDPNGRVTTLAYEPNGLLTTVVDPYGSTMEFEYTPEGKLTKASASDREVNFDYDTSLGQLSAVEVPDGATYAFEYNFRGQLTTETAPDGGTYAVEYDTQGKVYQLRDPAGETIADFTNPSNWQPDYEASIATGEMHYIPGTVTVIDAEGNTWQYTYNTRGHIVQTVDPAGGIQTVEYDSATLRPSRITDANGHTTEYEYDTRGNRTVVRDAEGNETQFEYEPLRNRITRKIEPDGDVWEYEYDTNGNQVKEIDPLIETPVDATIEYDYYPDGRLWRKRDRNGNVTEREYNPDGTISRVIDPAGGETSYTYDAFGNIVTETVHNDDPGTPANEDQTTTYTYDGRDRVVTKTDPTGTTTHYEYDAKGRQIAVHTDWVDETNYRSVTRYEYDSRGRLVRVTEDDGGLSRTTHFEYDNNGNRTGETNPNGVVTQYEYDGLGRLVRTVRDPGGLALQTHYTYDPVGNKVGETDPNGNTTTYQYDALNRQRFVTDPLGNVTEYRYFAGGGGGGGGCACGTPGSSLVACIIDALGRVTRFEYDRLDRRILEVRQVGVHDCDAAPDGDDALTAYTYDPHGNRLSRTDPNGVVTTYTYTSRHRVAGVSNGCGETVSYVYDWAGNRIAEHRPNGNVIHSAYDLGNRLVRVYDALGDISTYTYDSVGDRITRADSLGHITTTAYDNLDRVIAVTDPMGQTTQYEYDTAGNQTKVIDREGNETVYQYDAANRRIASSVWPVKAGPAATTTYTCDGTGNLTGITDANGNATTYTYDAAGRRIAETYADGTSPRFVYDAVGNLVSREDHMGDGGSPGNIITYTYDDLNRLVRREYANGEIDVFTYDKGRRLLSADNAHSHVGFTYDCAGRIATTTQTDLPQTYSYTITYAYNIAAGTRTITYPSGKVVVETRDARERLADVSGAATYAYDLANRVLTKTFANGTETRYAYNDNDWITELRHVATDGVTTFAGFAHDYDREGNRLNARNLEETIPYNDAKPVTHSEKYTYDDTYRLIDYQSGQWVGGDIATPRRHRTWDLDPVHNWREFGIHDLDTGEDAVYCNSVNQMNEYDDPSTDGLPPVPDDDGIADDFMVTPCAAPAGAGGSGSPDFDGDGDVDLADFNAFQGCFNGPNRPPASAGCDTADFDADNDVDLGDFVVFQAAFNGPNRPAAGGLAPAPLSSGYNQTHDKNGNLLDDGEKEYYYDYQTTIGSALRSENRLTMVKDKDSGTVLGEYRYDALGRRIRKLAGGVSTIYVITPGWREIEEYENAALARSYTFGAQVDEILRMDRGTPSESHYYHADSLGSVLSLTDLGGQAVERYSYDPYGEATVSGPDGSGSNAHSAYDNPWANRGRRLDPETSLLHYRQRMYNVRIGRFVSRDPDGYTDGLSLYAAYHVPHFIDPLGTSCCPADGTVVRAGVMQVIYEDFGWGYKGPYLGTADSTEVQVAARLRVSGTTKEVNGFCKFSDKDRTMETEPLPNADEAAADVRHEGPEEYWKKCSDAAKDATFGSREKGQCVQCLQYVWEVKLEEELDYWKDVGLSIGLSYKGAGIGWEWKPFEGKTQIANPRLQVRICADGKKYTEVKGALNGATRWKWYRPALVGHMYYRYRGEVVHE